MRKNALEKSGLFFRSNVNGWSLGDEFVVHGNTLVCRNVKIKKGLNEFKIADAYWRDVDLGCSGNIMLYHNYEMTQHGCNCRLEARFDYTVNVFLYKKDDGMFVMRIVAPRRRLK